MNYKRGASQPTSVLSVEQARRINAELRLELVAIAAEKIRLENEALEMQRQVTLARRKLRRQARDLEEMVHRASHLSALHVDVLPEPVHGGPEGLKAAAEEWAAHEETRTLPNRRRVRVHNHGTRGRYEQGCECDRCMGWRKHKSDLEREAQQRRRSAQKKAAA